MTGDELDRRITDGLRALADEAQPSEALRARVAAGSSRARGAPRRWLPVAAAVTAIAVLSGTLLAITRDGGGRAPVSVTAQGEDAADPAAQKVVERFLEALQAGDVDGAARLVSTYATGEGDAARQAIQRWLTENEQFVWSAEHEYVTSKSFGWTLESELDVVTVTAPVEGQLARSALAFVVGPSTGGSAASGESLQIQRLGSALRTSPELGTSVAAGERIVVAAAPLEGGATAHLNGREVEVVVDLDAQSTSVVVPEWAAEERELVLTMSFATPELPGAGAAWFDVDAGVSRDGRR